VNNILRPKFFQECLLNPVLSKKKHFRIDYPVPTSRSPGKGLAFHWYFCSLKSVLLKLLKKISMEGNTLSACRYRIFDAEKRLCWILFNVISSFCDLKILEEHWTQYWIYFPSSNKRLQKENMVESCDFICHVTCLLNSIFIKSMMNWLYMCDTSMNAHWRQVQHFSCSTVHNNIKKIG
jgi:hypothetical protein